MNITQERAQIKYTRSISANFRSRSKQQLGQGMQSVIVPRNGQHEEIRYKVITDSNKVEETLINCNIAHFGQAQGTTFMAPNLNDDFGYTGVTTKATQLIQGQDMESLLNKVGNGEKRYCNN